MSVAKHVQLLKLSSVAFADGGNTRKVAVPHAGRNPRRQSDADTQGEAARAAEKVAGAYDLGYASYLTIRRRA